MVSDIKNATIESTSLTTADHGTLSAWVYLDYGGAGQGFGGWALYLPNSFKKKDDSVNFAGHFIYRVLEVAEVDEWGKLPGKTIRVRATHSGVEAIGHIVKDIWFHPKKEFEEMTAGV